MVKPSLAQNRLGGPPTEVPIPSNPTQSSATCCETLFFKPVFKPIQKSQALCECFWHTSTSSNSSTIMHLNVEEQKQNLSEFHPIAVFRFLGCQIKTGYICAMIGSGFQVMLAFFSHPASATTWKRVSELTGTQSFPTPSHSFFIGNSSLLSLYFSWHSFVRWRAMFVLDYEILGMRSLRVFQLSFAHALTRGASLVAASPGRGQTPLHLAAEQGHVEVVVLLLRSGASVEATDNSGRRPQSCRSHGTVSGRRADAFYLPATFVQVDLFPVFA